MDSDSTVSQVAKTLVEEHEALAAGLGISRLDVVGALAIACGRILATCRDIPGGAALRRMDDLRRVMEAAYEQHLTEDDGRAVIAPSETVPIPRSRPRGDERD